MIEATVRIFSTGSERPTDEPPDQARSCTSSTTGMVTASEPTQRVRAFRNQSPPPTCRRSSLYALQDGERVVVDQFAEVVVRPRHWWRRYSTAARRSGFGVEIITIPSISTSPQTQSRYPLRCGQHHLLLFQQALRRRLARRTG